MSDPRASETAFETVIEAHLLASGYVAVDPAGFDRNRAIFPLTVMAFIRDTQPEEWARLEALHDDKTGEQVLTDLCKWLDANGSLATLRHGFKSLDRALLDNHIRHRHQQRDPVLGDDPSLALNSYATAI